MTKASLPIRSNDKTDSRPIAVGSPGMVMQRDFFPLKTLTEYPEKVAGADAWGRVTASDSHDYIVKSTKGGPHVPACELIGTILAEKLNLACPTHKIIEVSNGDLVFGSRVISGISDELRTSSMLFSKSVGNRENSRLGSYLSQVYAFDMFISNIDRHDRNFISVDDNGTIRFYLIDFGRSLIWSGAKTEFPLSTQPTRQLRKKLEPLHGFDLDSATSMLDMIASLSDRAFTDAVAEVPEEWLSLSERTRFLSGWRLEKRLERVTVLRKGFADGSFL